MIDVIHVQFININNTPVIIATNKEYNFFRFILFAPEKFISFITDFLYPQKYKYTLAIYQTTNFQVNLIWDNIFTHFIDLKL